MPKKIFKFKCDDSRGTGKSSQIRFIAGESTAPAGPGQPNARTAKSVITALFTDKDAAIFKDFDPGKEYTITIEG